MAGFRYSRPLAQSAGDQMVADTILGASQTINEGDCITLPAAGGATSGTLIVSTSAATKVDFVAAESMATGATGFQTPNALVLDTNVIPKPKCYVGSGSDNEFVITIAPLVGTVQGGATTTVITAANASFAGASANDYRGGMAYVTSQGPKFQQPIVASGVASGNNIAFTLLSPLPSAPVAGDTMTVVPFGIGGAPKLLTKNTLSCAVADKTGGPVEVMKIDLKNKSVYVRFL